MQTVADRAGVSRATISLALRNHPSLPLKTRQRIQALAQKLGYRPNPLVATLMAHLRSVTTIRSTETLAWITSWPTREGWRSMRWFWEHYLGVAERAQQLGYKLEEFWLKESNMTAKRLSHILFARGIRGLIIAPLPHARGHLSLDWSQFASAAVGYTLWKPDLHRAVDYQMHSMTLALRQLKRLGYQTIGLAMESRLDQRVDHNWLASFLVYQHYLDVNQRVPILLTRDWNEPTFLKWFRKHQPDVCISVGSTVLSWLRKAGWKVPAQVGYVDLTLMAATTDCTGINRNYRTVGAAAVDLVIGQLHRNERGIPDTPKTLLIEGRWVDGKTVRNLRAAALSQRFKTNGAKARVVRSAKPRSVRTRKSAARL